MSRHEQPEIPGLEVVPCQRDLITYRIIGGDEVRWDGTRVFDESWQDESFGGQPQDTTSRDVPTKSKFGEYWIELVYKKVGSKTYGLYRVKRWRDENGRKRCEYLGKVQSEPRPDE